MSVEFNLPAEDVDFLNATGFIWELSIENNVKRVVIKDYPVCQGFNLGKVDVYFRIESTYPDTQIDMAYFHPPLARTDGVALKAIANDHFAGKTWQRWSRHRTEKNPWRPGVDGVETQLALVDNWLKKELAK